MFTTYLEQAGKLIIKYKKDTIHLKDTFNGSFKIVHNGAILLIDEQLTVGIWMYEELDIPAGQANLLFMYMKKNNDG
jgi:hypothetical protein